MQSHRVVRITATTLDAASLRSVRAGIEIDLDPGSIALDLSRVTRVGLDGLCALRSCQRALEERGGELVLHGMSAEVCHQVTLVPFARMAMLEMAHA